MNDESSPPVRSTVMEVAELKAKKRRGTMIIVGIIVLSVVGCVIAYYLLRKTPCELVTSDMCGFANMTENCPTLEKAMTDMGADEAWCENLIKGKEDLEPEQFSGHYLTALRTLLDENLARYEKTGGTPPEHLLQVQEKVDPAGAARRKQAAEPPAKAPPPASPAGDGGASGDGAPAASGDGGPG